MIAYFCHDLLNNQFNFRPQCCLVISFLLSNSLIMVSTSEMFGRTIGYLSEYSFDLEKAYDTTWKYSILRDLQNIGFKVHWPNFIQNFLSNGNFNVRLGSTISYNFEKDMGVLQGSILSVSLFSLKVNSLATVL